MSARQRLDALWAEYAQDPVFQALRTWKDPDLGPTNLVPGEGTLRPRVVFVGEAPGADEDRAIKPFVGASGQLLRRVIREELGLDPFGDCYITNVVKYRPPGNATPSLSDRFNSEPYLRLELACLNPRSKVIVPLGAVAWATFDSVMNISSVEGTMRMGKNGWLIVPMFHPSYILRRPKQLLPRWRERFAVIKEAMEATE